MGAVEVEEELVEERSTEGHRCMMAKQTEVSLENLVLTISAILWSIP